MRKKNYRGRVIKRYLPKCNDICRTYDPIMTAYADLPLPGGGRVLPSIFTMIDKMHTIEKDNKDHPEKVKELMGIKNCGWIETDLIDN